MGYSVEFIGATHIGLHRYENQDRMICNNCVVREESESPLICGKSAIKHNVVFGVFDGMGGSQCGGVAAMLAAQNAEKIHTKNDAAKELFDCCVKANKDICSYKADNKLLSIGTTAAVMVFEPREVTICNIGDTKIFRISKNRMEQISTDHAKRLSDGKRYLTQSLGESNNANPEPYIARGQYRNGDQYLICSDGLTDMVTSKEILQIIQNEPFEDIVPKLLKTALMYGGKDNITIILCKTRYHMFG